MPRDKRDVRSTASGSDRPVAPPDLWAQMDALAPNLVATPPANAFTTDMFAERRGLSQHISQRTLAKLVKEGRLTRVRIGKAYWYTVTP